MTSTDAEIREVDGHQVRISSPDRLYFPRVGVTKRDLVDYYLSVAAQLMPHCLRRPCNLERFPRGVDATSFVQKRLPADRPDWLGTAEIVFGSGGRATELCPASIADVAWAANLGAITVHPWSLRLSDDGDRRAVADWPDELRIDLDPMPGVGWDTVRRVAAAVAEVLDEDGIAGFPKTSGASGIHVLVRIEPTPYLLVRAAAVALAREVERRRPDEATSSWWREQRGQRVFLDYNQNLWDRSMACAYAVRPTANAQVSLPFTWDELDDIEPGDATVRSVAGIIDKRGDPMVSLDASVSPLDGLAGRAERDVAAGLDDLPLPPHYPKLPREPPRVPPSRARRSPDA